MNEEITPENIVGKKVSDLPRKVLISIVKNDGNLQMTTSDYVPGRFRVALDKGIITEYYGQG